VLLRLRRRAFRRCRAYCAFFAFRLSFFAFRHFLTVPEPMPVSTDQTAAPGSTLEVGHEEFRSGVPAGRFHLIVNPERAQKYIRHRLFVVGISLPLLGIGAALAISGYLWAGLPMVAVGFLLPRVVKAQAAKILLHLAMTDAKTYHESIEYEILEVRQR
jgi:hypothetical protein